MRPLGLRLWQGLETKNSRRPSAGWDLCRLSNLRSAMFRGVMGPDLGRGDEGVVVKL